MNIKANKLTIFISSIFFCSAFLFLQSCSGGGGSSGTSANTSLGSGGSGPGFSTFSFSYPGATTTYVVGGSFSVKPTFSNIDVYPFSFSVQPALPYGMRLDESTGEISGVPLLISSSTAYEIKAKTNKGTAIANLQLATVESVPQISLPADLVNFYVGKNNVSVRSRTSGVITGQYSINPALPAGLTLDSYGVISGQPQAVASEQVYTVKVQNSLGSAEATIKIAVQPTQADLIYNFSKATYKLGTSIVGNAPIFSTYGIYGRTWSVNPRLPTGLALSTDGRIEGTPTALAAEADYTITVETMTGPIYTSIVNLKVVNAAPNIVLASSTNLQFPQKVNFSFTPVNKGGVVNYYSLSPATLPDGVSFSTSTGRISGTAKDMMAATDYTITAINELGSSSIKFSLKIAGPATQVDYPYLNLLATVGTAIDVIAPKIGAGSGEVNWYVSDKELPAGLVLNNYTGQISGAITEEIINKSFLIVASGPGGFQKINLRVSARLNVPKINSLIASACTSLLSTLCWMNTEQGLYTSAALINSPDLKNVDISNLDGEVESYTSSGGRFLLSSQGSLFVADVYGTKFSLVDGYSKNVKKILECSYGYTCILMKSGVAAILTTSNTGTNPTQVSVVTAFGNMPTDAIDMELSRNDNICFISNSGSMKCRDYNTISPSSSPLYDITSVVGALKFTRVLGGLCAQISDGTVKCFGASQRPTATGAVLVDGVASVKKVVSFYGYACALSTSGSVKCWGRDRIAATGAPIPTPCSGDDCPPPVTVPTVDVPGLSSGVLDITMSDLKVCALMTSNQVKCVNFDPKVESTYRYTTSVAVTLGEMSFGIKKLSSNGSCVIGQTDVGGVKTLCLSSAESMYIAR